MKKALLLLAFTLVVAAAQEFPATALPLVPSVDLPRGAYFMPTEDCDSLYQAATRHREAGAYGCILIESDPAATLKIIKARLFLAGYQLDLENLEDEVLAQLYLAPNGGNLFLIYQFFEGRLLALVIQDVIFE